MTTRENRIVLISHTFLELWLVEIFTIRWRFTMQALFFYS